MKRMLVVSALVAIAAASPRGAFAQPSGRARPGAGVPGALDDANITPAEIRRMFDSYALMQAQDQLKISEEQFPKFLTRFKALQDIRRRTQVERNRRLQALRQLTNDPQADETPMKEQVKALQELEERSQGEIRKAYDAIDQVLDVRQQARFRVFEEVMEQRMLQLITRARQANRSKPQQ